jgi:YebC/PmpR family DNA-binding regulatory protein
MAGHSQFKNIMYRKGAQDIKRAKIFAKISREIMVASKLGSEDPSSNPRLRSALSSARLVNMPKDNIERALKKALGNENNANYEDVRYEGYGPSGVAFIVESLTDNRNRTASDIRFYFSRYAGVLGEVGSVAFQFDHIGLLEIKKDVFTEISSKKEQKNELNLDLVTEWALDIGAEDVEEDDETFWIYCAFDDFSKTRDGLFQKLAQYDFKNELNTSVIWKPKMLTDLDEDTKKTVLKLIDALEDHDDVQHVFTSANL